MKNRLDEHGGCACGAGGMDRRSFLTISAYAAAAAALTACAMAESSTAPTSLNATIKVSDFAALGTVGGVAVTNVSGTPIAIVRTGASTFITLSRVCPHQGTTVNATSSGFRCPNHGATFDMNGTWVSGQRTSSMRSYATTFDSAAGTLTIG